MKPNITSSELEWILCISVSQGLWSWKGMMMKIDHIILKTKKRRQKDMTVTPTNQILPFKGGPYTPSHNHTIF
jgi:hypothetical protein